MTAVLGVKNLFVGSFRLSYYHEANAILGTSTINFTYCILADNHIELQYCTYLAKRTF